MEGLTVLTKWEDMAAYAYIALKNYPKSERHTLDEFNASLSHSDEIK